MRLLKLLSVILFFTQLSQGAISVSSQIGALSGTSATNGTTHMLFGSTQNIGVYGSGNSVIYPSLLGLALGPSIAITNNGGGGATIINVAENQSALTAITVANSTGSLSYSLSGTNVSSFTIDSFGILTFLANPNYEAQTSYSVTVSVTDSGTNTTATQNITVNITNVNEAPIFTNAGIVTGTENTLYTYTPTASDVDGDSLTIIGTTLPSWLQKTSSASLAVTLEAFAGKIENRGFSGDGGAATAAKLDSPRDMVFDSVGNMYIADMGNFRVRKVATDGTITTIAGDGRWGTPTEGGDALSQSIEVNNIAIDSHDNIYVNSFFANKIYKISTDGKITTYAGNGNDENTGDGGTALAAGIRYPKYMVFDKDDNLYVYGNGTYVIRKIDSNGTITTFAGTGTQGYSPNGTDATSANIGDVLGISADTHGNIYFSDSYSVVRKIDTAHKITTIAGIPNNAWGASPDNVAATTVSLKMPGDISITKNGTIYISELNRRAIRKISSDGMITTVVNPIYMATALALDNSENLYASSGAIHDVKKLTFSSVTTFAGTPTASGVYDVNLTVTDGELNATQNYQITVADVNDPPIVFNNAFVIGENSVVGTNVGMVSAYDEDGVSPSLEHIGSPEILTFSIVSGNTNGDFDINSSTGAITVAKKLNAYTTATYTLTVEAKDDSDAVGSAIITIAVSEEDAAPVAVDENVTIDEDTNATINLLANDTDLDGNINNGSVVITVQPKYGSVDVNGSGVATYLPRKDYFGSDYFTYKIYDKTNLVSNEANVTLTINPINDAPVASSQVMSTLEDTNVSLMLREFVLDVDIIDNLSFSIVSNPTHGTVSLNNGMVQYTPYLNYYGYDSFTYKANDGTVDSNMATLFINLAEVNDVPIARNDYENNTTEDTAINIDVLANDEDDEALDATSIVVLNGPANGSVTVQVNGTITYTPNPNWFGTDSFEYTVKDTGLKTGTQSGAGVLISNPATVIVNVSSVNDAPVAVEDTFIFNEDNIMLLNLHTNDRDVESSLSGNNISIKTSPTHGQAYLLANGLVLYVPIKDYFGFDGFTYTINDGDLNSSVATVNLIINSINDAPTLEKPNNLNLSEDFSDFNITLNGTDIDSSSLTYSAISKDTQKATVSISGNILTLHSVLNANGVVSIDVNVTDGNLTDAKSFDINISAVDDVPVLGTLSDQNLLKNSGSYYINLIATDVEGDPISYEVSSSDATVVQVSIVNGKLFIEPAVNSYGLVDINITISANGQKTTKIFTILITDTIDADSDGIPDDVEYENNLDTDNDGIPNYRDTDSDGDGKLDRDEGTGDLDLDGIPNYKDAVEIDPDQKAVLDTIDLISPTNFLGTNVSTDEIISNLNFTAPLNLVNGVLISWNTIATFDVLQGDSQYLIIDNEAGVGTINRSTTKDIVLRLNATITKGAYIGKKSFVLTILRNNTDEEAVNRAWTAFDWFKIKKENIYQFGVISDLELLTTGSDGVNISWASSNSSIVSNSGVVIRGSGDETVTLTATFTKGTVSRTKTGTVKVLKAPLTCEDVYTKVQQQLSGDLLLGKNRSLASVTDNLLLGDPNDFNLEDKSNLTLTYTSDSLFLNVKGKVGEIGRHTVLDKKAILTAKISKIGCATPTYKKFDLTIKALNQPVEKIIVKDINDTISTTGEIKINFDIETGDNYDYADGNGTNRFIAENTSVSMVSTGLSRESSMPKQSITTVGTPIENILTKLYTNGVIENITEINDGSDIKQNIIRSEKLGSTIQRYPSGKVDINATISGKQVVLSSDENGQLSHNMINGTTQTKALSNIKGTKVVLTDASTLKTSTPIRGDNGKDYDVVVETNTSGVSINSFNVVDNNNYGKTATIKVSSLFEGSTSSIGTQGDMKITTKVVNGKQAVVYTDSYGVTGYKFINVGDDDTISNRPFKAKNDEQIDISLTNNNNSIQVITIVPLEDDIRF